MTCNGLKRKHISLLLKFLRRYKWHENLPSDYRTLLKSIKKVETKPMSPGKYYHFGLLRGLLKICENIIEAPGIISLFVNYDGVPMTKSSNVSLWPILGHVREISDDPFIVGIYCGPGQPDNTYDVIADFVKEAGVGSKRHLY